LPEKNTVQNVTLKNYENWKLWIAAQNPELWLALS